MDYFTMCNRPNPEQQIEQYTQFDISVHQNNENLNLKSMYSCNCLNFTNSVLTKFIIMAVPLSQN